MARPPASASARFYKTAGIAGLAYFAIVFAAGFALGVLRVLVLVPHLGETLAVIIEGPVILAVSWLVCRSLITRLLVPRRATARLVMGATAFGLLMVAEAGLSMIGFGRSVTEHLGHYQTTPGLLGLLGQIAFALFPVIQLRMQPTSVGKSIGRP